MPSVQRGSPYKTSRGWGIRWYDQNGRRRRQAGFSSKSDARAWFDEVEAPRMRGEAVEVDEPLTFKEFVDRYIARYEAVRTPVTVATLRQRLSRPLKEFGDRELGDLRTGEIAAFEAGLPSRYRYAIVRALRQVLDAAVAWEQLASNPAKRTGPNPAPSVVERAPLEPREVDALAEELRSPFDAAIVVGAWCYLRPAELLGLERRDVGDGVLHVRGTKTARSVRTVPLPMPAQEALEALKAEPVTVLSKYLFPGPSGEPYDLCNWRRREFVPAREAAGLDESVTPYTLRHSGISWALAAGIPPSDVARFGGTSVTMLERVYAHLLESSTEAAQARLDAFARRLGQESATAEEEES